MAKTEYYVYKLSNVYFKEWSKSKNVNDFTKDPCVTNELSRASIFKEHDHSREGIVAYDEEKIINLGFEKHYISID